MIIYLDIFALLVRHLFALFASFVIHLVITIIMTIETFMLVIMIDNGDDDNGDD